MWASRWALGSVEVVGDLRLVQAINASLYVLRSSKRDDWPHGLRPGGLTTNDTTDIHFGFLLRYWTLT